MKTIAIYMDHFSANFIEHSGTAREVKTITSDFNHFDKKKILQKGESHLHNKEQDLQHKFYEEICNNCSDYNQILLFGPTTAKLELHTILTKDNRFLNIEIVIKNTDKLNINKQLAFVNNFLYADTL
ncbi:hypothetical protein ACSVH2_10615 [Flavobacterium sp. RSB2_4_14]|uniref:hypothetical protein n=1 Tax=Flavobacterium sp. RSB2_4_14 TaxID=3447665 RepID=UPI003F333D6E